MDAPWERDATWLAPAERRAAAREALGRRAFDVLVIGGGVIGAGTAAHAAR